jgi:AMP deaminase
MELWNISSVRYLKDEDQASYYLERELIPEREYQRVSISGEEKCGVSYGC